jgi:hypothetical protein
MRLIALAAALLAGLTVAAAADDFGGTYTVEGTNLDGSAYSGQATITITSDTTCVIEWTTGSSTSSGICMRYGDAFAAGYEMGGAVGLVIYKIMDDGSLDGVWTITGQAGSGTEVLTPAN